MHLVLLQRSQKDESSYVLYDMDSLIVGNGY